MRDFRRGHENTRVARRGGDLEARYPYGTYAAQVIRNEPVDEVLRDAFVTAPGPTFADVQAELAARRVDRDEVSAGAHAVTLAVRDAFENEAADIAADAELELANAAPGDRAQPGTALPTVPAVLFV